MEILLTDIFDPRSIKLNLESASKEEAFAELIGAVASLHPELDPAEVLAAIVARENKMSTGIAPGVAIPHAIPHAICKGAGDKSAGIIGAIGISKAGIEYDALDGKPVHAIFMLIIGERANHLRALNQICALAQSEGFALIRNAKTPRDVQAVLAELS